MKPTIEQARAMFAQGGAAREFALQCYTEVEMTNTLSKTWEEAIKKLPRSWYLTTNCSVECYAKKESYNETHRHHLPTEELCKAMIAFHQLILLREEYRGGWVPKWDDVNSEKWCIWFCRHGWKIEAYRNGGHTFSFPSKEIAEEFLTNFQGLLDEAKILLT
jgi:hypothetical protein